MSPNLPCVLVSELQFNGCGIFLHQCNFPPVLLFCINVAVLVVGWGGHTVNYLLMKYKRLGLKQGFAHVNKLCVRQLSVPPVFGQNCQIEPRQFVASWEFLQYQRLFLPLGWETLLPRILWKSLSFSAVKQR